MHTYCLYSNKILKNNNVFSRLVIKPMYHPTYLRLPNLDCRKSGFHIKYWCQFQRDHIHWTTPEKVGESTLEAVQCARETGLVLDEGSWSDTGTPEVPDPNRTREKNMRPELLMYYIFRQSCVYTYFLISLFFHNNYSYVILWSQTL